MPAASARPPAGAAPAPARGGARGILRNTLYRTAGDIGSKIASLALYVVMARELGATGFGVFTFALATMTLVTALARFGQDTLLVREISRSRNRLEELFANTLGLKLALALPPTAVAFAVLVAVGTDAKTAAVASVLGLAVLAEALLGTPLAVFQAYERLELIALVLVTQRWITAIVGIAALLLGADVVVVAAVYLGGALLALAFALTLQLRRVARPALRIDRRDWRGLLRAAAPLGLAGVFGTILFRVDAVLLGFFESKAVVGNYGAAYRLYEATLFLSWGVGAAVYPVFSRLSTEEGRAVLERSVKLVLALTLPFALGAAVHPERTIDLLYGSEYGDAADALRLLAPAIALFPIAYVIGLFLIARDRQRALAVVYGAIALVNIALNLVLIPLLSLEGAAIATSATEALLVLFCLALAGRAARGLAGRRMLAGPIAAAAAGAGAVALLLDDFALSLVVGAAAFVLTLLLVERALFPQDVDAVRRAVRRSPS